MDQNYNIILWNIKKYGMNSKIPDSEKKLNNQPA